MRNRYSFQQMILEQLDIYMPKINLDIDRLPFTKINTEWIIGVNVKCKTINS